jgi:hypothetical protein
MSIFSSIFGTAPTAPTAPTGGPSQVANPGQPLPGTQATQQTAPNGMIPSQSQALDVGQPTEQNVSPLDAFKTVWETPANTPADSDGTMFGNVDPQQLMASAGKVDFAKAVTPEQLQAIASGGQGAVEAFASAMNKVAQSVYAQSAFATTKIVDQALAKAQTNYDARLPSMVKKFSVNENLQADNPLLSNPALTPLVSALSEQFVRKNPTATSSEIQKQVNDYFSAIGVSFAPKPVETPASRAANRAAKQEDWSAFLG